MNISFSRFLPAPRPPLVEQTSEQIEFGAFSDCTRVFARSYASGALGLLAVDTWLRYGAALGTGGASEQFAALEAGAAAALGGALLLGAWKVGKRVRGQIEALTGFKSTAHEAHMQSATGSAARWLTATSVVGFYAPIAAMFAPGMPLASGTAFAAAIAGATVALTTAGLFAARSLATMRHIIVCETFERERAAAQSADAGQAAA